MPRAVSIFKKRPLIGCDTFSVSEGFPATAATGDTRAARLAGEREDSSTVKTPTITPLMIPMALMPNCGIGVNVNKINVCVEYGEHLENQILFFCCEVDVGVVL